MAASYDVTYYKNDGSGTSLNCGDVENIQLDQITSVGYNWDYTSPTPQGYDWSRSGYTFVEWNTSADGTGTSYAPGATNYPYTLSIYAIWQEAVVTPDVTITYNNSTIATMNASGTEVLETNGKMMADDISVEYTKPTPSLQNKTVSPTTNSQSVVADSGYDGLGTVTVNAISPTKAAQTYTPTTSNQTIASGRWLTGTQTIKGDANLVAANIKNGVSIFNVTGTYGGGGGGDIAGLIQRTVTTISDSTVTAIGSYAFYLYSTLATISFPNCTTIGAYAFSSCGSITSAIFPSCTTIGSSAFYNCKKLTTISFPKCTSINGYAFGYCSSLTEALFPSCTYLGQYAFYACYKLTTASFPLCTSVPADAFYNCSSLATITCPSCTSLGNYAFYGCSNLISAPFPLCTSIGANAFYNCKKFTAISFPNCTSIGSSAFYSCQSLATAWFSSCTYVGISAFRNCYHLLSLYMLTSAVPTLSGTSVFTSTPIGGYTTSTGGVYGSIFVKVSLLASFQSATNWSAYSARMSGLTDAQIAALQ